MILAALIAWAPRAEASTRPVVIGESHDPIKSGLWIVIAVVILILLLLAIYLWRRGVHA